MDDYRGAITFADTARYTKGGAPPTVSKAGAARLRNEALTGADAIKFIASHTAAMRVVRALDTFSLDLSTKQSIQEECENMPDVVSLNPAMLAGAFYYFTISHEVAFNENTFRKYAPMIISRLMGSGVIATQQIAKEECSDAQEYTPEMRAKVYLLDLFRYVSLIGMLRGIPRIPVF